jgi:peptidoglycan/xylan/chitin deacetylase (PgdA/CDA1 family)
MADGTDGADSEDEGPRLVSPATSPTPISWPDGVVSAACLTFDMDAEAPALTTNINSVFRMTPMSHQSYGPLVGVPRILDLLAEHEIKATFFIPGYTAHRYPRIIRMVAEAGHEIAHHSYFHENTIGMDEQTEAEMIDLGLKALYDVAGVRPSGYRAPMWELNFHTPKLLAERGFRWDSSLMDSDHPYLLSVDGGVDSLAEIPVWWGLDDWEQYAFLPDLFGSGLIESPAKALEMWTWELEASNRIGGVFDLCCHPFLSGRPSRVHALDQLIQRMKSLPGLWITTVGEVADHVLSLDLEPRHVEPPVLPTAAHWIDRPTLAAPPAI